MYPLYAILNFFIITFHIFSKENISNILFLHDKLNKLLKYTATIRVSIVDLKAIHFKHGLIDLNESPHFFFVRDFVEKNSINLEYVSYIRSQYNMSIDDLVKKISVFVDLINCYQYENPTFIPTVTTSKKSTIIWDGFHRMSILTYFHNDIEIEAHAEWIIYQKSQSSEN